MRFDKVIFLSMSPQISNTSAAVVTNYIASFITPLHICVFHHPCYCFVELLTNNVFFPTRRVVSSSAAPVPKRRTHGVKINHLPHDTSEKELETLFREYGSIASFNLRAADGECYAFVNFLSKQSAQRAASQMNGVKFRGKQVNCKVQGGAVPEHIRSLSVGEYPVKVTSLSKRVTEDALSDMFSFGNPNTIQSIKIISCSTGPLNYAYVNYYSRSDADRAVASLDCCLVHGEEIRVKLHSNQAGPLSPDAHTHRRAGSYPDSHQPMVTGPFSTSPTQSRMSHSPPQSAGYIQSGRSPPSSALLRHTGSSIPTVAAPLPVARAGHQPTSPSPHHTPHSPRLAASSKVFRAPSYPGASRQPGNTSQVLHRPFSHPAGGPVRATDPQPCTVKVSIFGTLSSDDIKSGRSPPSSALLRHTGSSIPTVAAPLPVARAGHQPTSPSPHHTPHSPRLAASSKVFRAPSYPGASRQPGNTSQVLHRPFSHPAGGPVRATDPQPCTVKVSIFGTLSSDDIKEVFARFGTLRDDPIIREGDPKYVFINFTAPDAAVHACSFHNSSVRGVKIHVKVHSSQKQTAGVDLEPREITCTPLTASILATKWKEALEELGKKYQVTLTPKHNCVRVWGPREQVAAVELCLQSLLERVEGEVSVKDCELPGHSVPLFEQDSAVEKVQSIEANHGVEFRVLRAPPNSTPVDLTSFCQDVKQCFIPTDQNGSSTSLPTCSQLDWYLNEEPQSPPAPTATTWQWQNDSGTGFTPYTPDVSSKLSRAFVDSPSESVAVNIGSYQYSIDLSTMTQTNIVSGRARSIRPAPSEGGTVSVQWFYTNDEGDFVAYAAELSDEMEQMFQSKVGRPIIVSDRVYTLNFTDMTQCNVLTLHTRKIERRVTSNSEESGDHLPSVQRVLTLQASGLPESLDPCIKELRELVKRATVQKECQLNCESSKSFKTELVKNMNKYFVTAELMEDCLRLTGMPRYVERVHLLAEQQMLSNREQMMGGGGGGEFQPPVHWSPQSKEVVVEVVRPNSEEWNEEVGKVRKTLRGASVVRLERIQNKWLWERYSFARKRMLKTNKGHVNEKHLFHGTRGTPPEKVFRSEKGVDFRFSREGLWGTGSYFAVNASYSDPYAYSTPGGINEKQMFICQVLAGDSYNAETNTDRSLRQPPLKSGQISGSFEERYDSVKGYTKGSHVYVVYDHEKVYPAYLVTYRKAF